MYHLVQRLTVEAICALETLITLNDSLNDAATLRATICINIHLYCCTVHFEDSLNIIHPQLHQSYIIG